MGYTEDDIVKIVDAAFSSATLKYLEEEEVRKEPHVSNFVYPCLPSEETIMTENGLMKVSEVKVGIKVLTHKGRYRNINQVFEREYDGDLIELKRRGISSLSSSMTPEHPILVRDCIEAGSNHGLLLKQEHWIEASKLEKDDFRLCYPRYSETEDREFITVEVGSSRRGKKGERVFVYVVPVNEDLMKLIGYYVAEGSFGKSLFTRFSFGKNDKELAYANEVVKSAVKLGFSARKYYGLYGWQVDVQGKVLMKILDEVCGYGARNKKIALWVKRLPLNKLQCLFEAYMNGDGYERRCIKNTVWEAGTVSHNLALDIRDIAMKLGFVASIFIGAYGGESMIMGRRVNTFPVYVVHVGVGGSGRKSDDNYIYGKLVEKKITHYVGKVYNFEVEEDNSYCTESIVLHNCQRKGYWDWKRGEKLAKAQEERQLSEEELRMMFPNLNEKTLLAFALGKKLHEIPISRKHEYKMKYRGVAGTADEIFDFPNLVLILDKKTTTFIPKKPLEHHQMQIEIYAAMYKSSFAYGANVVQSAKEYWGAVLYVNLDTKEKAVYPFKIDVGAVKQELDLGINEFEKSDKSGKPPKSIYGWWCGYCSHFTPCRLLDAKEMGLGLEGAT